MASTQIRPNIKKTFKSARTLGPETIEITSDDLGDMDTPMYVIVDVEIALSSTGESFVAGLDGTAHLYRCDLANNSLFYVYVKDDGQTITVYIDQDRSTGAIAQAEITATVVGI